MEENRINPWLIAFRVVFTVALLLSIAFIFKNSLQVATDSQARSQEVTDYYNYQVAPKIGTPTLTNHQVRKLAHLLEYTLEGFWLMLCLRVYTRKFVRHISWPVLIGVLTALSDETLQTYIAGRSSELRDVWIDTAGLLAGIGAAFLILMIFRCLYYSLLYPAQRRTEERERQRQEQERQLRNQNDYYSESGYPRSQYAVRSRENGRDLREMP